jgi:hypothetical protein
MKCTICEQNHDKEGLEHCVAALVVKSQRLEKQCYKNAGTFGRLLDALVLSWDKSLNGNEMADKMRAVTQEYGYCMSCRAYCDGYCDS